MVFRPIDPKIVLPPTSSNGGLVTPSVVTKLQSEYVVRIGQTYHDTPYLTDETKDSIATYLARGVYVGDTDRQPNPHSRNITARQLGAHIYENLLKGANLEVVRAIPGIGVDKIVRGFGHTSLDTIRTYVSETQARMQVRSRLLVPHAEENLQYPEMAFYYSLLKYIDPSRLYGMAMVSDQVSSKSRNDLHRVGYVGVRTPVHRTQDKIKYDRKYGADYLPPNMTMLDLVRLTYISRHVDKTIARLAADFVDTVYNELTARYQATGEDIDNRVLNSIDGIAGYDLTRLILSRPRENVLFVKMHMMFKALYATWPDGQGENYDLCCKIIDDYVSRIEGYSELEQKEDVLAQLGVVPRTQVDDFAGAVRRVVTNLEKLRTWLDDTKNVADNFHNRIDFV